MSPEDAGSDAPLVAYRIARADGRVVASRRADERCYAASTAKLAVLGAAARAIDAGTLSPGTAVPATATFESQVPGAGTFRIVPDDIDPGMPPEGTPMPFRDVLRRMIVVSSNEATNVTADLVGLDAVNRVFADVGAASSVFGRRYSDRAAAALGATIETTAADLAALLGAIVAGRVADGESTTMMLGLLHDQHDRLLTDGVAPDASFGSKSGAVAGIRHDIAFFGEPGPDALVVAVCTRGFPEPAAEETIRAIGAIARTLAAR